MCITTVNHHHRSHGSSSCCVTESSCCQPCFPSRDQEINKLEQCRDHLQKNVEAVEKRLNLLKNAK